LSTLDRMPEIAAELPETGAPGAGMAEEVETEAGFLPYLQLLWEHRRGLLRAAVASLLISVLAAFLIPVRYRSVTRLMPPDGQSGSLGLLTAMAGRSGGLGGGLAADLLGAKSSGALLVGVLNSQTVQDRLIARFELMKVYGDSKIEDARSDLAERSSITEDRKSGIITVAVTDRDPRRAAAMAQAYVAELDRLVAAVSTSSARRERIFLEGRLASVRGELNAAARNFSEFASKNTAIDIPTQGRAMVEAAATLEGRLIAAQAELSGLRQAYGDSNVRVRAAQARAGELRRKLNDLGGAGSGADATSSSPYPSLRQLPLLGVTYADLYRQVKIQETVYELLTQQYELAKVEEAKEIPTVKVLDPALVPTKKSFPPRAVIAVLGTMLGIALALTWIAAKTRWEALAADDPRRVLGAEVWAAARARVPRWARGKRGHATAKVPS
jgi:uncharacterized protein involved in exopolysaccharide biosynthesis